MVKEQTFCKSSGISGTIHFFTLDDVMAQKAYCMAEVK